MLAKFIFSTTYLPSLLILASTTHNGPKHATLDLQKKTEHSITEHSKPNNDLDNDYTDNHASSHIFTPKVIKIGVLLEITEPDVDVQNLFTVQDAIMSIKAVMNLVQNQNSCLPSTLIVVVERKFSYLNGFDVIEAANDVGKEDVAGMVVLDGCTSSLVYKAHSNFMKIPSLVIYTHRCGNSKPDVDRTILGLIARLKVSSESKSTLADSKSLNKPTEGPTEGLVESFIKYHKPDNNDGHALKPEDHWYAIGAGYSDVLMKCLFELFILENIKKVIFYADKRNWAYK